MTAKSLTIEILPPGEPWAAALATDESAIASDRDSAVAVLFPTDRAQTTADAIAEYTWLTSRLAATGYGDSLADLHGRSVASHPELARLLRSPEALADVGAAAAHLAAPAHNLETHAAAGARASAAAVARYQLAIARQLADTSHKLAPAARALIAADDLARRLATAKAQHEENARAEIAIAEEQRRAAHRAVIDRTVERVRAAEARLADARARVALTEREYRAVKADALVERLRLSGLTDLRIGRHEIWSVDNLIQHAHAWSIEQLDHYEAGIAAHEAGA